MVFYMVGSRSGRYDFFSWSDLGELYGYGLSDGEGYGYWYGYEHDAENGFLNGDGVGYGTATKDARYKI